MRDDQGILYLALKKPQFLQMCMLSMASLRQVGYTGPVAVVSDLPQELWHGQESLGYRVFPPDTTDLARLKTLKTRADRLTPFRRTLLLDCDTMACRDLGPLWDAVESRGASLAMALDRLGTVRAVRRRFPNWGSRADWDETIALCGADSVHYNGGVIFWESVPKVHNFFTCWQGEMERHMATEQTPLIRALHLTGIKPVVLPGWCNVQTEQTSLYGEAVIRHYSGMKREEVLEAMLAQYLSLRQSTGDTPSDNP